MQVFPKGNKILLQQSKFNHPMGEKQYYRTNTRHNPNTIHFKTTWPWPTACLKNYWDHMVIIYKWVIWTNMLQYERHISYARLLYY